MALLPQKTFIYLNNKYNQLNTKFKDLKESKVVKLNAVNQRLDNIQLSQILQCQYSMATGFVKSSLDKGFLRWQDY